MKTIAKILVTLVAFGLLVLAGWLTLARIANAGPFDLGGDACCVALGEMQNNTQDMDSSMNVAGGSGLWQSAGAFLDQMTERGGRNLRGRIEDFPGEELLPPRALPIAERIVGDSMTTYANAWAVADAVQQNFGDDDNGLGQIEQVNAGVGGFSGGTGILGVGGNGAGCGILCVMQLVVESNLHIAQEMQYNNQLLATEIKMQAIEHAEALSERAPSQYTEAVARDWGHVPQ
jgi:hypothetical protein